MSRPVVLIIDDQYADDEGLRLSFLENAGFVEAAVGSGALEGPLADAVFCSGQRRENNLASNDYQVIKAAVEAGPPDGGDWALVFLDVRFDSDHPGSQGDDRFGEEARKWLAADFPNLPVVMLSTKKQQELHDHGTPYLAKLGLTPQLIATFLLRYGRLTGEQRRALLQLPAQIVMQAESSFAIFREAFAIAAGEAPVLILGETGTGKEVVARYIHQSSRRAGAPFVAKNMAAIAEGLAESEVFGHEKGAFTGADRKSAGLFAQADGGTLFLDEIGDMPLSLQSKLLRALQDGEVWPVGATKPFKVDVRIIAATSRDLAAMQRDDSFREDLFSRINAEILSLPPLRERPEDITALVDFYLQKFMNDAGKLGISLATEGLKNLHRYPFPGNVRELGNIIQRLVRHKSNNSIIFAADVREALTTGNRSPKERRPDSQQEKIAADASEDHSLERFFALLATWTIAENDPLLQGGKPRLQLLVQALLQKMAGACLVRCRDPRNGRLNRQAAMQLLTGDNSLTGKGPARVLNEILGRKADTAITDEDLEQLIDACLTQKEGE